MMGFQILLAVHIVAGYTALAAGIFAIANKQFDAAHKWHVRSGTLYVICMAAIVCTAIPIAWQKSNRILLLIAVFSGYLIWSGWRYAKNRQGKPFPLDWCRVGMMAIAAVLMFVQGVSLLRAQHAQGYTLLVFGGIGTGLGLFDFLVLRGGGVTGKSRIAMHLTMMLSGFIATVTAFLVVNVTYQPAIIVWLAPTVALTPLIVWWNFKVRRST